MDPYVATVILFGALIIIIALGLPIAYVLILIGSVFLIYTSGLEGLMVVSQALFEKSTNYVLIACPLFVFMATFLQSSGLAEDMYKAMFRWVGQTPGGIAWGTMIICAIFAAMAGISGVATITMGLIALPAMLDRGYNKRMAVGTIAAGGALGVLIPPSVIAIIYSSLAGTSAGKVFIACIIPGIVLTIIFIIYIVVRCLIQPELAPKGTEKFTWSEKFVSLKGVILPAVLILVVLGSIYGGITTATEAAAIGALGAVICSIIYGSFTFKVIMKGCVTTLKLTSMVIWIVFGATVFSRVYTVTGASSLVTSAVAALDVPPILIIGFMQFIWFILGCLLDPAGMCMITLPIFLPIVYALHYDPLWFAVLFVVNSEMAYLTPPFGFNLFYLKAIVPKTVTMFDIYMSVWPFVGCQALCLILVMAFPELCLWLPATMK